MSRLLTNPYVSFARVACLVLALAIGLLQASAARADDDWDQRTKPSNNDSSGNSGSSHGGSSSTSSSQTKDYSFTLPYLEGEGTLSFDDLAKDNKPFILVWWLSDCPVCHLELPYVEKLEKLVEDNKLDLRVVSINIDDGDSDCKAYVKDKGVSFEVLHDDHCRRTDSQFGVRDLGTPVTYIFKPGGVYASKLSGYSQDYISKVLKSLDIPVPDDASNSK